MSTFLKYIINTAFSTFVFSFLFTVFIMLFTDKNNKNDNTNILIRVIKKTVKSKNSLFFFVFVFFTFAVFYVTVIQRECVYSPLSNVFGGWNFYNNQTHKPDFLAIGNVFMFVPSSVLLCTLFLNKKRILETVLKAVLFSFLFSLFIEICQLIFSKGTFQFSDIFYNTVGGLIGAIIYLIIKLIHTKKGTE